MRMAGTGMIIAEISLIHPFAARGCADVQLPGSSAPLRPDESGIWIPADSKVDAMKVLEQDAKAERKRGWGAYDAKLALRT
jgi:hypothetical protein